MEFPRRGSNLPQGNNHSHCNDNASEKLPRIELILKVAFKILHHICLCLLLVLWHIDLNSTKKMSFVFSLSTITFPFSSSFSSFSSSPSFYARHEARHRAWQWMKCTLSLWNLYSFFFFFFPAFRATPRAYPQVRGQIRATDARLGLSHSNAGSEPCLRPTP